MAGIQKSVMVMKHLASLAPLALDVPLHQWQSWMEASRDRVVHHNVLVISQRHFDGLSSNLAQVLHLAFSERIRRWSSLPR